MKAVTPRQFIVVRVIFGIYLFVHFLHLVPWAPEMFSRNGVLPDGNLNPTSSIFPNLLYAFDAPVFTQAFLIVLSLLALFLAAGFKRRFVSILLWYGWACLFNRNIFTGNPGLPFLGWMLLAFALIPSGESWSEKRANSNWEFPKQLYIGAWLILAIGYTASGLHKLGAPSWVNGSALLHVLENPLARDTFLREWLVSQPVLLKFVTWNSLFLEIAFAPLAIFRVTRPLAWVGIVGMHIGIIFTIDFADLTAGVLMIHLFTFDSRWLHWFSKFPVLPTAADRRM